MNRVARLMLVFLLTSVSSGALMASEAARAGAGESAAGTDVSQ